MFALTIAKSAQNRQDKQAFLDKFYSFCECNIHIFHESNGEKLLKRRKVSGPVLRRFSYQLPGVVALASVLF